MARLVLYVILLILLARALNRLWYGLVEGFSGGTRHTQVPQHGVQMVRDPVCGTFVVPNRALSLSTGRQQLYFCSSKCRDNYRAGSSTRSDHSESAEGASPEPVEGRSSTSSDRPEHVEGRTS